MPLTHCVSWSGCLTQYHSLFLALLLSVCCLDLLGCLCAGCVPSSACVSALASQSTCLDLWPVFFSLLSSPYLHVFGCGLSDLSCLSASTSLSLCAIRETAALTVCHAGIDLYEYQADDHTVLSRTRVGSSGNLKNPGYMHSYGAAAAAAALRSYGAAPVHNYGAAALRSYGAAAMHSYWCCHCCCCLT